MVVELKLLRVLPLTGAKNAKFLAIMLLTALSKFQYDTKKLIQLNPAYSLKV